MMISIIIPTFNEVENLGAMLRGLGAQAEPHQIIIADGGSADETLAIATEFGVKIVQVEKSRGGQLRAGANEAVGDVLFFLHADCQFPPNGLAAIRQQLNAQTNCVGGNFRLQFDGNSDFAAWLTGFYAWLRKRGLYYGDSGIFVRREVYFKLGGFQPLALMEDYEFTRRLEKMGPTCCIAAPALMTSSRRFAGRGAAGIIWGWLKIHLLYHLGISATKLAQIYDRK